MKKQHLGTIEVLHLVPIGSSVAVLIGKNGESARKQEASFKFLGKIKLHANIESWSECHLLTTFSQSYVTNIQLT